MNCQTFSDVSQACKMMGFLARPFLPLQGAIRDRRRAGALGALAAQAALLSWNAYPGPCGGCSKSAFDPSDCHRSLTNCYHVDIVALPLTSLHRPQAFVSDTKGASQ